MADFKLTLDSLFGQPEIMNAVINRIETLEQDKILWKDFLDFESTDSRVWKVAYAAEYGVEVGSIIDRNAKKPLRERKAEGVGYLEVMTMGDRWQLNNDILDKLAGKVADFNRASTQDKGVIIDEIVALIIDDYREAYLAPNKRSDLLLGQLLSQGQGIVDRKTNPNGVVIKDLKLPVTEFTASAEDQKNFMQYVLGLIEKSDIASDIMMMNRATFSKITAGNEEFKDAYKALMGSSEFAVKGGLITEAMANQVFNLLGVPQVKIMNDTVKVNGKKEKVFADDAIALLPVGKLGKMKYYTPLEAKDPIPTLVYNKLAGDHVISSERNKEGRFVEYSAEWLPEFTNPTLHGLIKLGK